MLSVFSVPGPGDTGLRLRQHPSLGSSAEQVRHQHSKVTGLILYWPQGRSVARWGESYLPGVVRNIFLEEFPFEWGLREQPCP